MIWNNSIITDIVANMPKNLPRCKVKILNFRGGDYDLNPIQISIGGVDDWLRLTPYVNPENPAPKHNDNVEIIGLEFLNRDSDSRGGCQSDNTDINLVYGYIKSKLAQAKFDVADHYDRWF